MVELTRVEEVTGLIPDPALCFHYIYLIIPPLLLHLYMYCQISCNFGEISFLLYFSNHFYLKKKGHAEIISVMCSLFAFRVYRIYQYNIILIKKKPETDLLYFCNIHNKQLYKDI